MRKTLRHEEPDRVPISDFFRGSFTQRWRDELGLAEETDPYYHYDLDWIVTIPNMDPWIRPFQVLRETSAEIVLKTGFGATMRKVFRCPMPESVGWDIDSLEKLEAAEFDPPDDPRRFRAAGDNHLAGVGDGFQRNSPAWVDTVKSLWGDFPVFGSMLECSECLTRLIGPENHLLWMAMEPDRMAAVLHRVGEFYLRCARRPSPPPPLGSTGSSSGATWPTSAARSCTPTTGEPTINRGSRRSSIVPTAEASR